MTHPEALSQFAATRPLTSTSDLIREAVEETRELVRLEIAVARAELAREMALAKAAGVAIAAATVAVVSSFTLFMVALASAFGNVGLATLVLACVLLPPGVVMGFFGYKALPRALLGETRERLREDLQQVKEHLA
jgi:Putative Actinobacterial Holin-X, holin superfamily III